MVFLGALEVIYKKLDIKCRIPKVIRDLNREKKMKSANKLSYQMPFGEKGVLNFL